MANLQYNHQPTTATVPIQRAIHASIDYNSLCTQHAIRSGQQWK